MLRQYVIQIPREAILNVDEIVIRVGESSLPAVQTFHESVTAHQAHGNQQGKFFLDFQIYPIL
jgi:hypothetical protein